jgi:hypothetical protein
MTIARTSASRAGLSLVALALAVGLTTPGPVIADTGCGSCGRNECMSADGCVGENLAYKTGEDKNPDGSTCSHWQVCTAAPGTSACPTWGTPYTTGTCP